MEAFIGTILPVGFNYPPRGWVFCNGQQMAISQNSALFALFGTMYGGNGQTTFGIPDLRGRTIVGSQAQGPGLQNVVQGQMAGTNNVTVITSTTGSFTLNSTNLPSHTHSVTVPGSSFTATSTLKATGNTGTPPASLGPTAGSMLGNSAGSGSAAASIYNPPGGTLYALDSSSVTTTLTGDASVTSGATGTGAAVTFPISAASTPTSVMQPYTGLNYICATEGIFPSRN